MVIVIVLETNSFYYLLYKKKHLCVVFDITYI